MAGSNVLDFYRKFQNDGASVQTGRIVSVGSTSCVVEVNGRNLSLVIMDSVTGLAVGKNVACLIQGGTGFIAGTISNANCGGGTTPTGQAAPTPSKPAPTKQNVSYVLHPTHGFVAEKKVPGGWDVNLVDQRILQTGTYSAGGGAGSTTYSFFIYNPKTLKQLSKNASLTITGAQVSVTGAGTYLLKRHSLKAVPPYDNVATTPMSAPYPDTYIDNSVSKLVTIDTGFSPGRTTSIRVAENTKTVWFDIPVSWATYIINNQAGGIVIANPDIVGNNKRINVTGLPNGVTLKLTGYIQN